MYIFTWFYENMSASKTGSSQMETQDIIYYISSQGITSRLTMKDCQTMKSAKLKLTEGIRCSPLIFGYLAVL